MAVAPVKRRERPRMPSDQEDPMQMLSLAFGTEEIQTAQQDDEFCKKILDKFNQGTAGAEYFRTPEGLLMRQQGDAPVIVLPKTGFTPS